MNGSYEKEIEVYGFHPLCFIDELYSAMCDACYSFLEAFQHELVRETVCTRENLVNGISSLESAAMDALDFNVQLFEEYVMTKVLSVPDDIELFHYNDEVASANLNELYEEYVSLRARRAQLLVKEKALNERISVCRRLLCVRTPGEIVEEMARSKEEVEALSAACSKGLVQGFNLEIDYCEKMKVADVYSLRKGRETIFKEKEIMN